MLFFTTFAITVCPFSLLSVLCLTGLQVPLYEEGREEDEIRDRHYGVDIEVERPDGALPALCFGDVARGRGIIIVRCGRVDDDVHHHLQYLDCGDQRRSAVTNVIRDPIHIRVRVGMAASALGSSTRSAKNSGTLLQLMDLTSGGSIE